VQYSLVVSHTVLRSRHLNKQGFGDDRIKLQTVISLMSVSLRWTGRFLQFQAFSWKTCLQSNQSVLGLCHSFIVWV